MAVSVGFGGFATLSMSRTGSGCFSSGNGDVMTTTTTTVQGSSVTPVDTCFSMQCISEGAQGAADKPTDGEEVSAGSGGEELAAFFEEEGNGGNGGNGPGVGGDEPGGEQVQPEKNVQSGSSLVRVGRWMSELEYQKMIETGMVQPGGGGITYAAYTPEGYMSQAAVDSLYVEFEVPSTSFRETNKELGWVRFLSPDSPEGRLAAMKGLPIPQLPEAQNISVVAVRVRLP